LAYKSSDFNSDLYE